MTNEDNISNNIKVVSSTLTANTTDSLAVVEKRPQQLQQQQQVQKEQKVYSHKGKIRHSKNTEDDGLDIEYLKPDLKSKIKEDFIIRGKFYK